MKAFIAAAAVAGAIAASPSTLLADDFYDSFTGLPKGIYYGTLDELNREGLPLSKRATDYLKQHRAPSSQRP